MLSYQNPATSVIKHFSSWAPHSQTDSNSLSHSFVFILFFSGSRNIFNWEIEDTSLISDLFKKPDLVYAVACLLHMLWYATACVMSFYWRIFAIGPAHPMKARHMCATARSHSSFNTAIITYQLPLQIL